MTVPLSDAQLAAITAKLGSLSTVRFTRLEVASLVDEITRLRTEQPTLRACACWPAYERSEHCPIYPAAAPTDEQD